MSINLDLTNILEKSPKNVYINSVTICIKLLKNIVDNPKDEKFRKFKKSNPKIANDLLVLIGMEQLFLEIGFEIDNEEFVLRKGGIGVISKIKAYRDFLQKRLNVIQSGGESQNDKGAKPKTAISSPLQKLPNEKSIPIFQYKITADKPFHQRIAFPQVITSNNNFLRQLESLSDLVMQYEDEALKKSALAIIPMERLRMNAIENLRKFQKLIKEKEVTDDEPPLDDFILEELAAWFKNEFFTWVNNMNCKICKGETTPNGTKHESGVRIEQFMCSKCNVITEFPRYNDIEKLLVTRSGRCGEFANVFTFLCRCLKYDARYIYCTSDHVWTEVYYHSKKRFVHIDPSENVFDSPLMYEHGWKRKLEYVIAFARDDVQDVSWRYSNQHDEIKRRRNECSEADLMTTIVALRNKRQANVSQARKKFLTLRTLAELSELMILREPTENERKGRSSGSIAWRLGRGECNISSNYVFKLLPSELTAKQFNIRYTCAKNRYERFLKSDVIETANDWKLWEFKSENIFRKIEHDHKMAYLSRIEDADKGMLQWKFDFGADVKIKSINLKLESKTFENGQLRVSFIDAADKIVNSKNELIGSNKFSISVHFSGGNGDCAWQHAQLFRQNISSNDFPFQLSVEFN